MSHRDTGARRPQGLVLYSGPSQLDGQPIIAIVTGFLRHSANQKTGSMLQSWLLRRDLNPVAAIHDGADAAICGSCPLRGIVAAAAGSGTVNRLRGCYVNVAQAPLAVFQAFQRGAYEDFDRRQHLELFRGRMLRIGSYGDPAAVPYRIWSRLIKASNGWTGYTHQWRDGRFWRYRRILMASVESLETAREAQARGWRTFRTSPMREPTQRGEFVCPASVEAGKRLTCEQCLACNGANGRSERASVLIAAHGSPATLASYHRMVVN